MIRAILLSVSLASFGWGQEKIPAPNLILKDMKGRTIRLGDYQGKVVLLNFWATWCAPCRAEMPDLMKWQREYQKHGLQVIGITVPPEEPREVRAFLRNIRVNYPVAIGDKHTKALFEKSDTLPITVVIDRAGIIRSVIQGIIYPEEFEEKIKPLLARP